MLSVAGSEYAYLGAAAAEAVAGRGVLRHSYIAAYTLQWGERRRWDANVCKLDGCPLQCLQHHVILPLAAACMQQACNSAARPFPCMSMAGR